jgi:hypothetical protein
MSSLKLPFELNDGATKRLCTYDDLYVIVTFDLDFEVYTKGFLKDVKRTKDLLYILYRATEALVQMNNANTFPVSYYDILMVVDYHSVSMVECLKLNEWLAKPMIKLAVKYKW